MITIITHPSPDGDAIGSSLGLLWYLKSLDDTKDVRVIIPDSLSKNLTFLNGQEYVIDFSKEKDICLDRILKSDKIYILDFNSLDRIDNELANSITYSKAKKTMIDHHRYPQYFCDETISDVNFSSTAEMIYTFVVKNLEGLSYSKNIAESLYTGIMTDTGSFRFPNCTSKVHRIIADLLDFGADHTYIHDNIYSGFSTNRLKMTGYVINNNLIIRDDWAVLWISDKEKKRFDYVKGDTEGLVNYPLSVLGIKKVCFLTESDDMIKLSFRSKGDIDVNCICRESFEGGGHKNASGGKSKLSMKDTIDKVVKIFSI
jgi:phosphoesterase RecJ-like protein